MSKLSDLTKYLEEAVDAQGSAQGEYDSVKSTIDTARDKLNAAVTETRRAKSELQSELNKLTDDTPVVTIVSPGG